MTLDKVPGPTGDDKPLNEGTGSVAHQIIGQFIAELRKKKDFREIASALASIIYDKPSEADLRAAMFKDDPL